MAFSEESRCEKRLKQPPQVRPQSVYKLAEELGPNQEPKIIDTLHEQYGDIFQLRLPGYSSYIPGREWVPGEGLDVFINNREGIETVLKNPDAFGRDWRGLVPLVGWNALIRFDESDPKQRLAWEKTHKAMAPFFTPANMKRRLDELQTMIKNNLREYLQRQNDSSINLRQFTFFVAYTTSSQFLFGTAPEFAQVMRLQKRIEGMLDQDADVQSMGRKMLRLVNEAIAWNEANSAPDSLYAMLKAAQESEKFPRGWVRDQMRNMLGAAFETTQDLTAAMLYEVGQRPVWADRLRQAAVRNNGEQPLYRLQEFMAFSNEALRVYPPVSGIIRFARKDFVVNGRRILKGARVTLNLYSLHRANWGETADSFDPDRLDPQSCPMSRTNAILPFGTGSRVCIGQFFAKSMAVLTIGELLNEFEIFTQDVPGEPFSYPSTMRVHPDLMLTLRQR